MKTLKDIKLSKKLIKELWDEMFIPAGYSELPKLPLKGYQVIIAVPRYIGLHDLAISNIGNREYSIEELN